MIWIALLVRWGINTLALIVIDWMFSGVEIGRWGSLLFAAAILTIGNTIIKPILAILTLPLIILTLGLAYFAINVRDARARRVGHAELLDRRLLDVCRRHDRRLARERLRRLVPRSGQSAMTWYELWLFIHISAADHDPRAVRARLRDGRQARNLRRVA